MARRISVGIDEAAGLRRDKGRLDAMRGHALGRLQNRGVLDGSGNEVVAGVQQAEDGGVVALGAAGVEDHLGVVAVEKLGHRFAGAVDGGVRLLAVADESKRRCRSAPSNRGAWPPSPPAAEGWWHWRPYRLASSADLPIIDCTGIEIL